MEREMVETNSASQWESRFTGGSRFADGSAIIRPDQIAWTTAPWDNAEFKLPVPVLDGGHIMYYAIEIVKGSPLPERAIEFGQRLGLAFGALFPIGAMPGFLATIAKFMPLTHALALLRYGLVDPRGTGLHDIWGMTNVTAMALLSLAVVAAFAGLMVVLSVRVFTRTAVR